MFGVKSDKYWYCFHSIPIKIDARDEMKIWETAIGWHCMKLLYGDTDYYVCNSRKFTNNSKHNYILRHNYILLPQRTSVYDEQFNVGVPEACKFFTIDILYEHIQVSGAS